MPYTIQGGPSIGIRICIRIGIRICIRICLATSIIIVTVALTLLDRLRQYSWGSLIIALSVLFLLITGSYGYIGIIIPRLGKTA